MSQSAGRSAVFLQEMGVGPQWTLRNPPPGPGREPASELPGAAPESSEQEFAEAVAALIAAGAPPAAVPAPEQPAAAPVSRAKPAPLAPPPSVTAAPDAASDAAPAPQDDSTAWFDDAPVMARSAAAAPAAVPSGAAAPVSAEAIANMDWAALQAAVSACTRCDLCRSRVAAVPGRGDGHAQWLALGSAPTRADEEAVQAISAEPGKLLDNMLRAIDLAPEEDVYITSLVKCRPTAEDGAERLPTPDELSACRPYLERELELAGTRIIVTLGQSAAKGLLGAAARGKVLRYDGIPTVATYHPADLLRRPADKAKAWADLCLAKAAHAGRV